MLGASWEVPGACWKGIRASWEDSGPSWEVPGASWEVPGASWEGPGACREGPGACLEGPGASWEAWSQLGGPAERPGGGTETERQNRALPVCGGTIGHRPLRGRCPKSTLALNNRVHHCHP